MGKITDITVQRNNKKRVSVFIDGKFAIGLESITVLNHRIEIGDEIEIEELEDIQLESEKHTAFDKAVRYLSARFRSEREMRQYLKNKEYRQLTVNAVVDSLKEYGYIDDFKFATQYLESRLKRYGLNKLKYELKNLGVKDDVINEAVENLETDEDEVGEVINKLAYKFMRTRGGKDCAKDKLIRHLYSKGFNFSDSIEAYKNAKEILTIEEADSELDEDDE